MARTSYEDEDDERWSGPHADDDVDPEAPDPSDQDDDEFGSETVPCPYCRREILEATDICPYCGSFISKEDAPPAKPGWMFVTSLVLLAAIIVVWVFNRMFNTP